MRNATDTKLEGEWRMGGYLLIIINIITESEQYDTDYSEDDDNITHSEESSSEQSDEDLLIFFKILIYKLNFFHALLH